MSRSKSETSRLNFRIQTYLRAFALRMPGHERFGPFLAGFDLHDDNPYRNYAVPDDDARPGRADIESLIAGFERLRRKPRLEYIAESAVGVEPALLEHGFKPEKRFPVMIATMAELLTIDSTDIEIVVARDHDDIVAAADVGAKAYQNATSNPDALRRLINDGGVLMVARKNSGGAVLGLGMATPPHEAVCEIAGIGVLAEFRRRGIAGALTSALTRKAFAQGVDVAWLTPGHDGAERIYARAGFIRASEQLHISRATTF